MSAARLPVLISPGEFPAAVAAVALAAEAGAAHAERRAAPPAHPAEERDARCRHRSRKPGVDSEIGLWDAQLVTV
jgi:hypothetical protein